MARQIKSEKTRALQAAKFALEDLINCGATIASSRAAIKTVIADDPEGERLLAIFEKRFGLAIIPIEVVNGARD